MENTKYFLILGKKDNISKQNVLLEQDKKNKKYN